MKPGKKTSIIFVVALLLAASCYKSTPSAPGTGSNKQAAPTEIAQVDTNRIIKADSEPGNWMSHGRTYDEQRYSPLARIDTANVADLGLAWSYDLGTDRGVEATSIMVDGILYATSSWSIVVALDARTGRELWRFDPKVDKQKSLHTCCGVVNRGVAVWEGKVYVGALDGRLIALDAATGKVLWETATVDPKLPYTITGAPRILGGKVMIGNGGAEFGVRGFISAYDADTGKMLWRFHTVPGDPSLPFENKAMEMAAKTWNGEWWKLGGGGGTVWDSMAYDPELDLLYIGVGNGTPWNQQIRSPGGGDNLFLSSIVALRPDTGEYVWHYQTTPGETWDYTATQHIILADMELEGETRKVLMQAPKNGFFYVIDRTDGTLLSANNYIPITWATHVDMKTGRPVEVPGARYKDGTVAMVFPSYLGGHNWHPMSYNPETGLVYIPVLDFPAAYASTPKFKYRPDGANLGTDGIIGGLPDAQAERNAMRPLIRGRLLAWDPKTQSEAWHVEHKGPWNGGTLTTAGDLVFQGTADAKFVAYRADNGKELWDFPTQTGIVAAPMTYELDGEQYVSVNVGWGGAFALVFGEFVQAESVPNVSRVLTFKLGAKGKLPPIAWKPRFEFSPPEETADPQTIAEGHRLYQDTCMGCHGLNAVSGLLVPDLRGTPYLHDQESWDTVVLEGIRASEGMPSAASVITPEESAAIRDYVIRQAWRGLEVQQQAQAETKDP